MTSQDGGGPAFGEDERVLVSPRHLAGGFGDPLGHALLPLKEVFGWDVAHHQDKVTAASPDGSISLAFEPLRRDAIWWHLAYEPYWRAEFTRQTPTEAIAAVTQSLPQLLGDRRGIDRIGALDDVPGRSRIALDWQARPGEATFTSPDGHCTLHEPIGTRPDWHFAHSVFDGFNTRWTATFTGGTPTALVAKFLIHLATTSPVERRYSDVPFLARDFAVLTPARTTGLSPHIQHALARIPPHPGPGPARTEGPRR